MKIQLSGEIKENINLYADLYNRGIDELKAVLEDYYEWNIFPWYTFTYGFI